MRLGVWSIPLKPGIPENTLSAIGFFDSVLITNQWLNLDDGWTDAQVKAAAIYSGMIRVLPRGDNPTLEGIGNLGWWGDENGRGQILTTAYTAGTQTHAGWWTALTGTIDSVPSPLTAGTLNAVTRGDALELTDSFIYVNRRTIADAIASFYEAEYRVNPDFTVDAGTESQLFTTTPVAILVRKGGGRDLELTGINIDQASIVQDVTTYTTKVVTLGEGVVGSDSITSSYKDPQNAAVQRHILASVDTPNKNLADAYADAFLTILDDSTDTLTITAQDYDAEGAFTVGDTIYIYDPESGLVDSSTQKQFRGDMVFPTTIRVYGSTWPVTRGMGVYTRTGAGALTDITDWVQWEEGAATLEVGAFPKSTVPTVATSGGHQHPRYMEQGAVAGSNPSASDGPDDYSEGWTFHTLSSATGWPQNTGWLETWISGTVRAYQVNRPKEAGESFERFWASSTTWDNWRLMQPTFISSDPSDYNIVSADTYETAATLIESGLPTSSFEAYVRAEAQCYGQDTVATSVNFITRVDISLDGGSTWTTGQGHLGETGGTGEARQHAFLPVEYASGSVTGTIQARLVVRSNSADSFFGDIVMRLQVGANY